MLASVCGLNTRLLAPVIHCTKRRNHLLLPDPAFHPPATYTTAAAILKSQQLVLQYTAASCSFKTACNWAA